jgi:predicted DCC family thiol-disulfide oxidoreductase YuxK
MKRSDLKLVDIHSQTFELPLSESALTKELHLQKENGEWVKGLEANVLAWQHTRLKPWVSMLLWPGIRWFSHLGYRVWLVWYQHARQKRLKQQAKITSQTTPHR